MLLNTSKRKPKPRYSFEAIGTRWQIDGELTDELKQRIAQTIERFDWAYSRFRDDSMVKRMAVKAGTYELPRGTEKLLALYAVLYTISDGRVTPLIASLLEDAGYDAEYSLRAKPVLRQVGCWEDYLFYDNSDELVIKQPVLLDFGAIGKGYLVDMLSKLLSDKSVTEFTIDAGGDIMHRGPKPLRVGLEHPEYSDQAIGIVTLGDGRSLCGSAGNRRAWGDFHHVIDPSTQSSPTHIKAVWVVASTTAIADGLTTALYFISPYVLAQEFTFEYAIVYADNSLEASPHFPAKFFNDGAHHE